MTAHEISVLITRWQQRTEGGNMQPNAAEVLKLLRELAWQQRECARLRGVIREIIAKATALAFDAERKMGEMLAVKPPARGAGPGRGKQGSPQAPCLSDTPTIGDLGLTKNVYIQTAARNPMRRV